MFKLTPSISRKLLSGAAIGLSLFFLVARFQLVFRQHFDIDEFAYLHWANRIVMGEQPIRDFSYFSPPGFLWYLAPAFAWFGSSFKAIFAARTLEFGAYLSLLVASGFLFWQIRRNWGAILVPLLVLFLPMPSIKFIEIRPDTLALGLSIWGMYFLLRFLEKPKSLEGVLSGLFYGLSLIVFQKMIWAPVATTVILASLAWQEKRNVRLFWSVVVGLALIGLVFGGWVLGLGASAWPTVIYSLTKLPFESSTLGKLFPIPPLFFFAPNAYFYGAGSNIALLTNNGIWLFSLGVWIIRILTAWRLPLKQRRSELLIALTLLGYVWFFWFVTPLRHAQYLIPLAVFVAWYTADGVTLIGNWLGRFNLGRWVYLTVIFGALIWLTRVFIFVGETNWTLSNDATLGLVSEIWEKIPASVYVLDLEGITLRYKDPYYVCCIPFGQYSQNLSRPLPNLLEALAATKTSYIYQGDSLRVTTLVSSDRQWVEANFEPWEGHSELLVRKDLLP